MKLIVILALALLVGCKSDGDSKKEPAASNEPGSDEAKPEITPSHVTPDPPAKPASNPPPATEAAPQPPAPPPPTPPAPPPPRPQPQPPFIPPPDPNAGRFKFTFVKRIFIDDEPFEQSCNQFFVNYWIDKRGPDCTPVLVNTDFKASDATGAARSVWTITSGSDGKVNLKAIQRLGADVLEIDGGQFYCLLYTGNAYDERGKTVYGGTFLVLSSKLAVTPSQLDMDDVVGVGIHDADFCAARF